MKVDVDVHRSHPWRVHELARDFKLLDVWQYPISADPAQGEDFDAFCRVHESIDPTADDGSRVTRWLFKYAVRWEGGLAGMSRPSDCRFLDLMS